MQFYHVNCVFSSTYLHYLHSLNQKDASIQKTPVLRHKTGVFSTICICLRCHPEQAVRREHSRRISSRIAGYFTLNGLPFNNSLEAGRQGTVPCLFSFPAFHFLFRQPVLRIIQVLPAEIIIVPEAQEAHLIRQLVQRLQEAFPVPGQDFADDESIVIQLVAELLYLADSDAFLFKQGVRQAVHRVNIRVPAKHRGRLCDAEMIPDSSHGSFPPSSSFSLPGSYSV